MLKLLQFKRRSTRLPWYHTLFWWTVIPLGLCRTVLWLAYRCRWYGMRNVPGTGPALFISNHQSHFDPILVGIALSDRCPRFLARETLKTDSRFWGWLIGHAFDSIWLNQTSSDPGAMKAALNEIREDRISAIFPEGTRTKDGQIGMFRRGAFLLIKRGMAPVIPVAIEGAHDVWPSGRPKPKLRGRIKVMIGESIPAEELIEMGPEAALTHVYGLIEGMRLQLREKMRTKSKGHWPPPGVGDQDGRDSGEPVVVS
jgi:1-acyl-sn-glycerol-3-phosphate acyltransferase